MFHLHQLGMIIAKLYIYIYIYLFQATPCSPCGTILLEQNHFAINTCIDWIELAYVSSIYQVGDTLHTGSHANVEQNPTCKRHALQHHQCYILCFNTVILVLCDVRQHHSYLPLFSTKGKHISQNYPQVGSTNIICCFQTTTVCLPGFKIKIHGFSTCSFLALIASIREIIIIIITLLMCQ